MARQSLKQPPNYEQLREASGWYARAWRDYRGLTLEDLAEEIDSSRGMVSDLETGVVDKKGYKRRYNADWVKAYSKALNVSGGWLIDVNPFAEPKGVQAVQLAYEQLQPEDQERALAFVQALATIAKAS